jgi:L-malate glycosyltransferase
LTLSTAGQSKTDQQKHGRGSLAPILVGPASPKDLADLMTGGDRRRADGIAGYRGRSVTELARALIDVGVDVEIATVAEEIEAPTTLEGRRLKLHLAPMRVRHQARDAFRRERNWLARLISSTEANVVHAHWTYEFALAALDSGRPAIVTARDAPLTILRYYRDAYRAMRTAMAYVVRLRTRNLTAVSPYLASAWRREMFYRRTITIVPNIVPPVATSSERRSGDSSGPVILEVADSSRRKNVPGLIDAMYHVLRMHPDARLRVIGDGLGEDSPMAQVAERHGVRQAIDFVGPLEPAQLVEEYSRAMAFVHASLEESFGLSIAEAMSHGLPVVAGAQAGGPPWLLEGGRAGLLADTRRPEGIAAAVCRLLDDEDLRAELGNAAAERVRTTFSPAAVIPTWIDLYDRAMHMHQ